MIFFLILKIFSKKNSRTFQEYPKNISPKVVTKAINKQAGVACVIPFAPYGEFFSLNHFGS